MRESSRLEIVQPTVRRSNQHDRSMRAYGAMPTLPVGIDERHLARAIVDEEIERIDRVDLDRELDQHVELGDHSRSARACDRPAATGSAAGLAAPVSDSACGCDAGRRRARSVLTTYPRHGVMRGNHRLTFAR